MGFVFNREVSGENNRERGSEASVEKQGQVVFGMLYIPVSRVLTLPAFIIAIGLNCSTHTFLQVNRHQLAQASACCVYADRTLTSRCTTLGNAPLAVASANDEWKEPDDFPGVGPWVWYVPRGISSFIIDLDLSVYEEPFLGSSPESWA